MSITHSITHGPLGPNVVKIVVVADIQIDRDVWELNYGKGETAQEIADDTVERLDELLFEDFKRRGLTAQTEITHRATEVNGK